MYLGKMGVYYCNYDRYYYDINPLSNCDGFVNVAMPVCCPLPVLFLNASLGTFNRSICARLELQTLHHINLWNAFFFLLHLTHPPIKPALIPC